MKQILNRVKEILIHPKDEWHAIKAESSGFTNLLREVAVLAALPPLGAIAGRLLFERGIAGNALQNPLSYVILVNGLWYLMILVNVFITGLVITALTEGKGSAGAWGKGLKIAVYSFTPLFVAGIADVIPWFGWLIYAAIAYALYLLYLGIVLVTDMKEGRAAGYAAATFLIAGAMLAVLNLFEYMLESSLTRILIFEG